MENGIKDKFEALKSGHVSEGEFMDALFEYRDHAYFKNAEGNQWLKGVFDSSDSNNIKCTLIYLLLNYELLEQRWHEKLAAFAIENIEVLNDTHTLPALYKEPDFIIYDYLTKRIFNPSYIKSKKWIYICSIPYDANPALAKKVLQEISNENIPYNYFLPYPISKMVSGNVLKKLA